METLVANITGKVRRETLDGRRYLVAPVVLMQGGSVMNGSKGALYYPPEECAREPGMWNNVPITDGHPVENGYPVSARSPEVLAKYKLGYIFNDRWDGSKRTAEAWYDEELTRNKSPKTYSALEANRPFDLSTGLMTDNVLAANGSQANGKAYSHIARNYRPDHVASLVGQTGACSLRDGCGVLVGNVCETCGKTPLVNAEEQSGPEKVVCSKCGEKHEGECSAVTNEDKRSLWRQLGDMLGITTTENAFCPTGKGGGQDNSCSSTEGGSDSSEVKGKPIPDSPYGIPQGQTVKFHDGEFKGYEVQLQGLIRKNLSRKEDDVHRGQIVGIKGGAGEITVSHSTLKKYATLTANQSTEGDAMPTPTNKEELVSYLTTNCSCHKGKEKVLNALDEETLEVFKTQHEELAANQLVVNAVRESDPTLKDIAVNELPAAFAKKKAKPGCEEEEEMPAKKPVMNWREIVPPEVLEGLDIAMNVAMKSKADLLDIVVNANSSTEAGRKKIRPTFAGMSYAALKELADEIATRKPVTNESNDEILNFFTGAAGGGGHTLNRSSEPDPNDVLEPFVPVNPNSKS